MGSDEVEVRSRAGIWGSPQNPEAARMTGSPLSFTRFQSGEAESSRGLPPAPDSRQGLPARSQLPHAPGAAHSRQTGPACSPGGALRCGRQREHAHWAARRRAGGRSRQRPQGRAAGRRPRETGVPPHADGRQLPAPQGRLLPPRPPRGRAPPHLRRSCRTGRGSATRCPAR